MTRDSRKHEERIVRASFIVTISICLFFFLLFGYLARGWIRGTDGQSYYALARSIYFDHDFDLTNELLELTPHPEHFGNLTRESPSVTRNWFHLGYAILAQPFFLLAHALSLLYNAVFSEPAIMDGYRGIFGIIVPAGTLVYAVLSLWIIYRILTLFFPVHISALASCTAVLSTSLIWYITGQPTYSHVHALFCISLLSLLSLKFYTNEITSISWGIYLGVGCLVSLSVMSHPLSLVFALLPIIGICVGILTSVSARKSLWKVSVKAVFAFAAAVLCYFPQMLYYKVVFGGWLENTYAYSGNNFRFSDPLLVETLFSTNHGLFLWTPISLLSIVGLFLLFKETRAYRIFIVSLSLSFLLNWYLVASYYYLDQPVYHGGNSFGSRYFSGFAIFFALGWGALLERFWRWKKAAIAVSSLLVLWNLQLMIQQRYFEWIPLCGVIPHMQVFYNYRKLPDAIEKFKAKHFHGSSAERMETGIQFCVIRIERVQHDQGGRL